MMLLILLYRIMMLTAFASVSHAQRIHPDIFSDGNTPGTLRGATVGRKQQGTKGTRIKPAKGAKQGVKRANQKAAMNAPTSAPTNAPTTAPEGGVVALDFTMLPYNVSVLAPSAMGTAPSVGSTFIFNDPLYDLNLTVMEGTFVGGLCHKTQLSQPVGATSTVVGAGYCFFTFTVSDGNASATFNAAGEVFDVIGGTLAVTGGTGVLAGAYGEVKLTPAYEDESLVDFFSEASLYIGAASLSALPIATRSSTGTWY